MKSKGMIAIVCASCAFAQIKLLRRASGLETNLGFGMNAAWFRTEWVGYRSRLLAPTLIHVLGGDLQAFLIVTFFGLVLAGCLAWRLAGTGGLGILHAGFAMLAYPWFQPWDAFEPAIFTAFVLLIVESKSAGWFMALFTIAIFNRQSAMFIPLWMILSRRMMAAGLICALFGMGVMWFLQHSGQPKFGLFAFGSGYGNDYAQERLLENLRHTDWLVASIMALILTAAFRAVRCGYQALGVTYLIMLVTIVVLGIVTETRVYLSFIPLWVLMPRTFA